MPILLLITYDDQLVRIDMGAVSCNVTWKLLLHALFYEVDELDWLFDFDVITYLC